jgi:hypothetical protein
VCLLHTQSLYRKIQNSCVVTLDPYYSKVRLHRALLIRLTIVLLLESQKFHHAKIIIFERSAKRNQNPSRYYNSIITNLKFQQNLAKISSFQNPHIIKIDLLLLLLPSRGQNPLSYYTL